MVIDELIIVEDGENKSVEEAGDGIIDNIHLKSSKNLFETKTSQTTNGLTITRNADGTYTINGTATASADIRLETTDINVYAGKYYRLSKTDYNGSYAGSIIIHMPVRINGEETWNWVSTNPNYEAKTPSADGKIEKIIFYTYKGSVFNDYKIGLQLEEVENASSKASEYVPYGGFHYNFAKEKDLKGLSKVTCADAVPEPIIDMQIMGDSTQTGGQLFDKTKMLSGFLPQTGAYPTTNADFPKATYQIIYMQAGQTVKVTFTGSGAEYGRIRYIDKYTNEVVGTVLDGSNTNYEYCTSTVKYNNGFKDGEITALKDFKLGVMVTHEMPSDFDLQIVSLTNIIPTPETPVEIESVGERTKNLISVNNYNLTGVTLDEVIFEGNLSLPATFSWEIDYVPKSDATLFYFLIDGNTEYVSPEKGTYYMTGKTLTMIKLVNWNSDVGNITKMQLEAGEQSDYEPYGYKVPIKTSGKNLIPNIFTSSTKNGITLDVNEDGTLHVYGTATADTIFNPKIYGLQPNTYFLSGCPSGGSSSTYRLLAYFSTPKYNAIDLGSGIKYTLTETSDVVIEVKVYSGTTLDVIYKPMLEVGNVKTDYEPYIEPTTTNIYLSEPLRKVGNYADYIDYKNKKVNRLIKQLVFDGTEEWRKSSASENRFLLTVEEKYKGNGSFSKDVLLCDRLVANNKRDVGTIDVSYSISLPSGEELVFGLVFGSLAEMVQYIKEQYNSGTPMIVDYVLATPTEETINVPDIETFRGTNYFEFATEVSPSFAKINYWKQIGTDVVSSEEIIQDGSSLLIIKTGASLTKSGTTLTIGG